MSPTSWQAASEDSVHKMLLGKRIRHFRTQAGLTLDALGERVGVVGSQLSLIENGRREPRLSLLQAIARELNVDPAELLRQEAPDARSAMELELERAQHSPAYLQLKLPHVRTPKTLSDEALESLIGLHRELARRSLAAAATPEEARRANTAIRLKMRELGNYLPEIERVAEDLMRSVGHTTTSAVTHRDVAVLAEKLGFTLIFVDDLPSNTRSITDIENGRIYLPPASIPEGTGCARSRCKRWRTGYWGTKSRRATPSFSSSACRSTTSRLRACCQRPARSSFYARQRKNAISRSRICATRSE